MAAARLLVDVHTHVYLPRYASLLRTRTSVPRILSATTPEGRTEERLVILDDEPSGGRPVGAQYWDREEKLKFMDRHGIDISVVRCVFYVFMHTSVTQGSCNTTVPPTHGLIFSLQPRPINWLWS